MGERHIRRQFSSSVTQHNGVLLWSALCFKEWGRTPLTQLQLFEPPGERPYICYTENVAKNNHGGFSQRKLEPKQVIHHANVGNPARCFVRLYKSYMEHRPTNLDVVAFYLTPLKKPQGMVWYSHIPVGHNTLSSTVNRICVCWWSRWM